MRSTLDTAAVRDIDSAKADDDAASAAEAAERRSEKKRAHRAEQLVAEIVKRHFDERPRRLRQCGGGLTNSVFEFRVAQGDYIVRTHENATKINDYLKEHWAMEAARAVGVPTPRVVEVGNFADGRPYMVSERVLGVEGRIAGDRLALIESLGRCAARLHTVRTHGFGAVFDWSRNELSQHKRWDSWLASGFDVEKRLTALTRLRLLDSRQAGVLRGVADTIGRWRAPPLLHHGDLRLKNVMVDDHGQLTAILDWEGAQSLPLPWWDLSLALHDLGTDEKEAFLAGYGLTPKAYLSGVPFIRFFNVLNYTDAAQAAAQRKDRALLERLRLRIQGGTDLYGF